MKTYANYTQVAQDIVESMRRSVEEQDAWENRTVTKVELVGREGICADLFVTTDCDSFAEKRFFVIRLYDFAKYENDEIEKRYLGKSELFLMQDYKEFFGDQELVLLNKIFSLEEWQFVEGGEDGRKEACYLQTEFAKNLVSVAQTMLRVDIKEQNEDRVEKLRNAGYIIDLENNRLEYEKKSIMF